MAGKDELYHILRDHDDVEIDELLLLPAIIERGLLIREDARRRPWHLASTN